MGYWPILGIQRMEKLMKKFTLTIVCLSALTGMAFAQGSVSWSTISAAAMTVQTNISVFTPLFGGGSTGGGGVGYTAVTESFYFELLYNTSFTGSQAAKPTTMSELAANWLDTGLSAINATAQAGKLVPIAGSTQKTVPWAAGVTNNIMLVGWSASLGTTWSVASDNLQNWDFAPAWGAVFFGMSETGYIAPNNSNPGATVFGTAAGSQGLPINSLNTQLYIVPIPEPGTMAIAGLAGLSLLLFRRRKA
jgi:hypothetical protein